MVQDTVEQVEYETVIGLEVHVELNTETKIFCDCSTGFGADPNTQICPVCLGLPGTLPVLNREVVNYALRAALALHCEPVIQHKFDRKNYHYPDLPKGYQISQFDQPLARDGYLEIETGAGAGDGDLPDRKRIGIRRLHLEEDAGKTVHRGGRALVDYNRTGVPLIEIVSEPDLRSPEEAGQYLRTLRDIIRYTGVSDVKMEEGSLRCDANISLRASGTDSLGVLSEVKNMNSFRSVERALKYEQRRHRKRLEEGKTVPRETRHWLEGEGRTISSRSKEEAHDYRYFPEPDLVPVELSKQWIEKVRDTVPELPAERQSRLMQELGLSAYDAKAVTAEKEAADFLDRCVALGGDPKDVTNWLMGDIQAYRNDHGLKDEIPVKAEHLVKLLELVENDLISQNTAQEILPEICESGQNPEQIVEQRGLKQVSDQEQLAEWIDRAIDSNPDAVESVKSGKEKAIGFLVGQVMQQSRGKANPQQVNQLLRDRLLG